MASAADFDVLAMVDMVDGKSDLLCPRHPTSTGCKVALNPWRCGSPMSDWYDLEGLKVVKEAYKTSGTSTVDDELLIQNARSESAHLVRSWLCARSSRG